MPIVPLPLESTLHAEQLLNAPVTELLSAAGSLHSWTAHCRLSQYLEPIHEPTSDEKDAIVAAAVRDNKLIDLVIEQLNVVKVSI
jgi:hypothetical protein